MTDQPLSKQIRAARPHRWWRLPGLIVALTALLLSVAAPRAMAQNTVDADTTLPETLTPEAINALVSRLSDAEVRELLLTELGARAPNPGPIAQRGPPVVDRLTSAIAAVISHLSNAVMTAPANARATFAALGAYLSGLGAAGALGLGIAIAAAFLAGLAVDLLYWRYLLSGTSGKIAAALPFPASVPHLALRLLREAGGALLALAAAAAVLALGLPAREARIAMTVVLWVWFVPRLAWIVLKFLLSPLRPELRLVVTDDRTARLLMVYLVGLLVVVGLLETVRRVVAELGAEQVALQAGFWANLLVFGWLAGIVVVCRSGLQSILRGREPNQTGKDDWIVRAYPAVAVIAILVTWLVGATAGLFGKGDLVRDGRHVVSLALILLAPMLDTAIRGTVRIFVPPMRGNGPEAEHAHQAATLSYVRIGRVVVFGSVVMIFASLWQISLFRQAGDAGHLFSGVFLEAVLILLCGFVVLQLASIFFNRQLANEVASDAVATPGEMDEGPAAGGVVSRLGTILPPLNWAAQAAVVVVTLLMALGHIGLNVTALLAGAGVIGIAIGFGAQKLVADVVSGLFFLFEDAFRLNEYVDTGGMEGTVEKIALRTLVLRKSDGALQCIPYGNIDAVTNFSRDWGTMKQVFTVPFDTNIEKVRKIFKKIGTELAEIPEYKDALIQPFKFKGVGQVNDVGIVVRGKFMFKPEKAQQFMIQRDIYRRVQLDFAAAGIQFARREVHVSMDRRDGPQHDAVSEAAAGAAAADAVTAALSVPIKTA